MKIPAHQTLPVGLLRQAALLNHGHALGPLHTLLIAQRQQLIPAIVFSELCLPIGFHCNSSEILRPIYAISAAPLNGHQLARADAGLPPSLSFGGAMMLLTFSTVAGGVLMIEATIFSTASPGSGPRSMLSFSASARKAASLVMVLNAVRSTANASAGMPGGPASGPSIAAASLTNCSMRRCSSPCANSDSRGTSGSSTSLPSPTCTSGTILFSRTQSGWIAFHAAHWLLPRPSTSPFSIA